MTPAAGTGGQRARAKLRGRQPGFMTRHPFGGQVTSVFQETGRRAAAPRGLRERAQAWAPAQTLTLNPKHRPFSALERNWLLASPGTMSLQHHLKATAGEHGDATDLQTCGWDLGAPLSWGLAGLPAPGPPTAICTPRLT